MTPNRHELRVQALFRIPLTIIPLTKLSHAVELPDIRAKRCLVESNRPVTSGQRLNLYN
jgi:hypothetical protein